MAEVGDDQEIYFAEPSRFILYKYTEILCNTNSHMFEIDKGIMSICRYNPQVVKTLRWSLIL